MGKVICSIQIVSSVIVFWQRKIKQNANYALLRLWYSKSICPQKVGNQAKQADLRNGQA